MKRTIQAITLAAAFMLATCATPAMADGPGPPPDWPPRLTDGPGPPPDWPPRVELSAPVAPSMFASPIHLL